MIRIARLLTCFGTVMLKLLRKYVVTYLWLGSEP
jgi:hypothetical protein